MPAEQNLRIIQQETAACDRCNRLRRYCEEVARVKRRAYRDWNYWGKPVPSFGDPDAGVLIVGLAPAAHGANRTGRMFTGDRSGDFLYRALYQCGFASQPESRAQDDGLALTNVYIAASVHCAPPDNKPTLEEFRNCRPFLERELDGLPNLRVVVVLGKLAFDVYLGILKDRGTIRTRAAFSFGHNFQYRTAHDKPWLVTSYHPSQQNTSTGKLTEKMLRDVFVRVNRLLKTEKRRSLTAAQQLRRACAGGSID
jgi:uracil-DNA glycosylase family 4